MDPELAAGGKSVSRRVFLEGLSSLGGSALMLAGMSALGFGIASAQAAPPALSGGGGKKIIVLGAGVAGMTSAYELMKAGYDVTVLEARSFAGGRCQTARKGFKLTELGGETQECDFDDGLYINHGPWRIPYHHLSTLHYTKEFNIPLEVFVNDNDHSYTMFEHGKGPLNGKPVRRAEIAADVRGGAAEILAKSLKQGALDAQMTADDREMLLAYLVHEGYLTNDLAYKGTDGRGYLVPPGAGVNPGPGKPSVPYPLSDVLNSKAWYTLGSVANYEQQRTMFQPVGGMDRVAKGFEGAVGHLIKYSTQVKSLKQDAKGVEIAYTGPDGKPGVIKGDYCICTIPLSPLERRALAGRAGDKVFPGYSSNIESSFAAAWHLIEYNLGGWAQWSDEERTKSYPILCEPDGRLYLAGEHLSYVTGWQAGGIESAWQQIAKLHARVHAA